MLIIIIAEMLNIEPTVKENIKVHEDYRVSTDGIKLFEQTWNGVERPKALINIIHGLNDHSSRYDEWARKLVMSGFIVRSFDLRGQGRSEGKRGYCSDISLMLEDINGFVKKGQSLFPDLPMFLYGHSLGGNLLINYASGNIINTKGIIITSPWFELVKQYSKFKLFSASLVSEIIPWYMVSIGLLPEDISRDPEAVNAYRNDRFRYDKINVKFALQCIEAGHKASISIYKINVPLLVMHGSDDRITSFKASINFVRNAGDRTTFVEWPGCYHELHHEINRDKIFQKVVSWLDIYTEKRY